MSEPNQPQADKPRDPLPWQPPLADSYTPPEVCTCCGQRIRKLNPHHMDRQKCRVLIDLARLQRQGIEWVLMKEGEFMEPVGLAARLKTAYCARAHATRLSWFGLVDWNGRRTGEYRVNENGRLFLARKLAVPRTIYCRDGQVVSTSPERVTIEQCAGVILDKEYWDDYPLAQVYPEDLEPTTDHYEQQP